MKTNRQESERNIIWLAQQTNKVYNPTLGESFKIKMLSNCPNSKDEILKLNKTLFPFWWGEWICGLIWRRRLFLEGEGFLFLEMSNNKRMVVERVETYWHGFEGV